MGFSINFSKFFHTVDLALEHTQDILVKTEAFMQIAESSGQSGAQKLAAVKLAVETYVTASYPQLVPLFETLWGELSAVISGLVSLYHATGLFVKTAPQAVATVKQATSPQVSPANSAQAQDGVLHV